MTVRSSTIYILAALVVALGAAPALADANLLANGSFEGGFTNTCGGVTCSAVPNSWQLIDYNIDGISSPAFGTYEGTKAVDMNGDRPGAIAQTFATEAGAEYAVTFALAGNHTCGGGTMTLQVSAAGTSKQFTYSTGTSFGPYQTKTFGFTATGSSTTIEFRSLTLVGSSGGAAQCGPVVDDVRVSEVITPVRATFNDDVAPIVTAYNPPERLIDGSGLHGVGPILSQTAEGGWWGPNNEGNGEDGANFKAPGGNVLWYGVQPIAEWPPLEFDLGGTAELTGLHIWNYAHFRYDFYRDRDTRQIDVYLSSDGVNYIFAETITLQAGNVFVAQNEFGQRGNIESVQTFPLTGTASHVRLKVRSNYGNSSETGLGEVRFSGILQQTNQPPVANAGPDQTVECAGVQTNVTLDGSGSSDPDGDGLTYAWTGSFGTASGPSPTVSLADGSHTLTLTVSDGEESSTDQVIVNVVDTTPPMVSLNGPASVTIECHIGTYTETGASAEDACDGTLPVAISGSVDVNTLGTYEVTYTATDASGNSASASRTVNVVDTVKPVVSLIGPATVNAECHVAYVDAGATASDDCDPAPALSVTSTVNSNQLGVYTVTYVATDASGNVSLPVSRTVNVVDTTPPAIILNGANPLTLECPVAYVEPGAQVSDTCDPQPTLLITGSVDGHTPGTYSITYTATDASGNSASASRTIHVVDTTAPVAQASLAHVQGHRSDDDDDDEEGSRSSYYRVSLSATDACDPNPALTAYIAQPLTPASAITVSYKRERKNRIEIKQNKKGIQVKLEGPDQAALRSLFDQALATGGFSVTDGQVVKLVPTRQGRQNDDDKGGYQYKFDGSLKLTSAKGPGIKLVAFATDDAGNQSVLVEVVPGRPSLAKEVAESEALPSAAGLAQNYPNPFNPSTTLRYSIAELQEVRLAIYNTMGQQVRVLVDQVQGPGIYEVEWNGLDEAGQQVAGGIYFYQLQAGSQQARGRMLFLK